MSEFSDFMDHCFDVKTENIKTMPKVYNKCDECKSYYGHEASCSKVTVEGIAILLARSREMEQVMRNKAARWLEQLQRATGKIAILKQENNKLRKNNEKLKKQLKKNNDQN